MASISVLKQAIFKLQYNNNVLRESISKSNSPKQIEKLQNQIAQNESMILDYEYRVKNNLG